MIVTVSGRSGLTNAYRSVLSTFGYLLVSGASRWLLAVTPVVVCLAASGNITAASAAKTIVLRKGGSLLYTCVVRRDGGALLLPRCNGRAARFSFQRLPPCRMDLWPSCDLPAAERLLRTAKLRRS